MKKKYILLGNDFRLRVGRLSAREEIELYRASTPRQGFRMTSRSQGESKIPKPPE